jgi:predicted extracellular nuclease
MLQEQDDQVDADPLTSEGIFIYDPGGIDVTVGDAVEVRGVVSEYNGLTEIALPESVVVTSPGNPLPTAASPTVPTSLGDPVVNWEAIEGMSVSFSQPLYVTGLYPHSAFGEVQLSAIGTQDHPNQVAAQDSTAAAEIRQLNLDSRVILDDGEDESEGSENAGWNPSVTPYLDAVEGTLRSGDVVNNLLGVAHFSWNEYEVHPVNVSDPTHPAASVDITRVAARPDVPDVGGSLKVASFNVLNYFTTLGSRGADTADEFERQAAKIVDAIINVDADIVGLMEIENNGDAGVNSAIVDLVTRLNAATGATRTYGYVDTGNVGNDAIAVAFIYDVGTVNLVGDFAILDSTVSPAFLDNRNRPAVVQTFEEASTAEIITVAVNHLKSKG